MFNGKVFGSKSLKFRVLGFFVCRIEHKSIFNVCSGWVGPVIPSTSCQNLTFTQNIKVAQYFTNKNANEEKYSKF